MWKTVAIEPTKDSNESSSFLQQSSFFRFFVYSFFRFFETAKRRNGELLLLLNQFNVQEEPTWHDELAASIDHATATGNNQIFAHLPANKAIEIINLI